MKLSDLKAAKYNPRTITDDALSGLGYSIEEFGDMSGIVINKRTGNLVSGHQRIKALQDKYGDLEIIVINNEVIKDSSVIVTPESIFLIREVDWPVEKEKAANIAANNRHIAGDFTPELGDLLGEIKGNSSELYESLQFQPLELDVPEVEIETAVKEWELSETYIPFWVVVRCSIENLPEIKEILRKLKEVDERISIETSENE